MIHGVEDGRVPHPLADPQLDADAGVEEEHGCQGEQEESHHDEGGVRLPVSQRAPTLLAADVVVIVQEVVLHLGEEREGRGGFIKTDEADRPCNTCEVISATAGGWMYYRHPSGFLPEYKTHIFCSTILAWKLFVSASSTFSCQPC